MDTDAHRAKELQELDDPQFFTHWSKLRHQIFFSGKSVSGCLRTEYAAASAEYRRRIDGENFHCYVGQPVSGPSKET
jgi:hypothetical protein